MFIFNINIFLITIQICTPWRLCSVLFHPFFELITMHIILSLLWNFYDCEPRIGTAFIISCLFRCGCLLSSYFSIDEGRNLLYLRKVIHELSVNFIKLGYILLLSSCTTFAHSSYISPTVLRGLYLWPFSPLCFARFSVLSLTIFQQLHRATISSPNPKQIDSRIHTVSQ